MIFTANPTLWEQMLDLPLAERLGPASDAIVDFIGQYNAAAGNPAGAVAATPDAGFVADLRAALAELPPVVLRKLEPRLLGIFFMRGVGASGITDVVAHASREPIGAFVVLDVDSLERSANGWATWKENTPFIADPDIRIEATVAEAADDTRQGALQYLLLHEFAHVLAAGEDFMPDWWLPDAAIAATETYSYLPLGWQVGADGGISPLPGEDFAGRDALAYYSAPRLPAATAPDMYMALERTALPTLYAATGFHDDFAECFATYVHEVLLGKPHRVDVYRRGERVAGIANFWQAPRSDAKAAFFRQFLVAAPTPFRANQSMEVARRHALLRRAQHEFVGLAPFLRLSIAGRDLREVAQPLLALAGEQQDNPFLWMNLATAMFAINQRDIGLNIQSQALLTTPTYRLAAARQPARLTMLVLAVAGDIAENTPIDCLLEGSDIDLIFHYATPALPLPAELPVHDALLVAISDSPANRVVLAQLDGLLAGWAQPVLNAPRHVPNTERGRASELLQGVPGLTMPPTRAVAREALQAVAAGRAALEGIFAGCRFPIIVRPVGSQAGRDLARIAAAEDLPPYLDKVGDAAFYVSRFVDYSGADGQFRKYRVALIDGRPYACHMGVSSHWMVHYVNAGMYEDAAKRDEEARFMTGFAAFAERHRVALAGIAERSGLDYLCIDCAESRDGELLIFEIDHTMVVHAMDPEDLFPYKQAAMATVREAFEKMLAERVDRRQ